MGLFPSNGVWRREERFERGIARLSAFSFGSGTSDNGEGPYSWKSAHFPMRGIVIFQSNFQTDEKSRTI